MTFTFDSTVSGTSANSLASVSDFNTYVEKLIDTDVAPKSTQNTIIQKLLVAATEVVNSLDFYGLPTNNNQALEWPRDGCYDRRGDGISSTTIPQGVKDAVCEMALWLWENEVNHAQSTKWEQDVKQAEVGGTLKFIYSAKEKPETLIPARVKFLLENVGDIVQPIGEIKLRR